MSNDPYILITADTHAGGSHAQYREYLDPEYREAFDDWRGGYRNPSQEHYGSKKLRNWDLEIRSNDQNRQDLYCLFYSFRNSKSQPQRRLCQEGFHDWALV